MKEPQLREKEVRVVAKDINDWRSHDVFHSCSFAKGQESTRLAIELGESGLELKSEGRCSGASGLISSSLFDSFLGVWNSRRSDGGEAFRENKSESCQ
jgi:hypothetical protein